MDIQLCTGEKKTEFLCYFDICFSSRLELSCFICTGIGKSTFYTCFCKCSHWHTTGFAILILSGPSLHPAKQETEIFPLNLWPVTNTWEYLGDLVFNDHCKMFSSHTVTETSAHKTVCSSFAWQKPAAACTQQCWLILSHALFTVSYYQLIWLCHQWLSSATRHTLNKVFLEAVPFAIGLGRIPDRYEYSSCHNQLRQWSIWVSVLTVTVPQGRDLSPSP